MLSSLRSITRFGDLEVGDIVDFGPEAVIPIWRAVSISRVVPATRGPAIVLIQWRSENPWLPRSWSASYVEDELVARVPEAVTKKEKKDAKDQANRY